MMTDECRRVVYYCYIVEFKRSVLCTLVPLCLSYDQKLSVFYLCEGTVTLSYVINVHDDYNCIRYNIQKEIIFITNSWF